MYFHELFLKYMQCEFKGHSANKFELVVTITSLSYQELMNFRVSEWNKESSLRRLPWCVVSESRICTIEELLELLAHQLHISDVESARLWTVEIDGSPCKRLLDNDSVTLNDLKIQQSAQVRYFFVLVAM